MVVGIQEIGDQSSLNNESRHAAQNTKGHVLWPGKPVDKEWRHAIQAQRKGQPSCWIEQLLDRTETELLVKGGTVVVDDQYSTENEIEQSACIQCKFNIFITYEH